MVLFWTQSRLEARREACFGGDPMAEYGLWFALRYKPDERSFGRCGLEYDQVQKRYSPENWTALFTICIRAKALIGDFMQVGYGTGRAYSDPGFVWPRHGDAEAALDHRRYWMAGHLGSLPMGEWLVKWRFSAKSTSFIQPI